MPFGPNCEYANFDACVRANQDKEDPAGYCAVVQKETEAACAERSAFMGINYRSVNGYKARLIERIALTNASLAAELRNTKLDWYRICNQTDDEGTIPSESVSEIFIYDEIGGSFGISASDLVQDLQEIDSDKINVHINSPGGVVFDAIAIYNALIQHSATVTTYVDSLAASAASIIAMAADPYDSKSDSGGVVMMVGSQLMIHDALDVSMGNANDMREMSAFLDKQSDNLASIYADRGGGDTKKWRDLMLAETWMFAGEAVDFGLADKVYTRKTPMPEEEPIPPDEKEDEDPKKEEENEEEIINMRMRKRHRLTNRGYKYAGRSSAPNPLNTDNTIDDMVRALSNIFGGK
jgi:ATP-dependent protease ClpP protease subunit